MLFVFQDFLLFYRTAKAFRFPSAAKEKEQEPCEKRSTHFFHSQSFLRSLFRKQTATAEKPETVYSLLDQLRDAYMPAAREEVKEVEDYAHAHGFYANHLQPWDFSYYSKKLKQEKYVKMNLAIVLLQ